MELPEKMKAWVFEPQGHDGRRPSSALRLAEIAVPKPGPHEVLVRMEAASCNPSDLAALAGLYGVALKPGLPAGFEGCGRVVGHGGGLLTRLATGHRVACGGTGLWAEYAVIPLRQYVGIDDRLPKAQAATMIANPFTIMALIEKARESRTHAMVITAAASQVGRGLIRLGLHHGIAAIAIVHGAVAREALADSGAAHVLDSTTPDFEKQLTSCCAALQPGIAFDAVSGPLTATIMRAMPDRARVVIYGLLDRQRGGDGHFATCDFLFRGQSLERFWLTDWIADKNLAAAWHLAIKVTALVRDGTLASHVVDQVPFDRLPEAVDAYAADMTAGKRIIVL